MIDKQLSYYNVQFEKMVFMTENEICLNVFESILVCVLQGL